MKTAGPSKLSSMLVPALARLVAGCAMAPGSRPAMSIRLPLGRFYLVATLCIGACSPGSESANAQRATDAADDPSSTDHGSRGDSQGGSDEREVIVEGCGSPTCKYTYC